MTDGAGGTNLTDAARQLIPGGVSSPARAFGAVGGDLVFSAGGEGARLSDVDGRSYVDYIQGFGSVILGHGDPRVTAALTAAVARGGATGMSCPDEVRLAERIVASMPGVERVRFVASGTEAGMTAARLARAATGRSVLVKFEGCYHGHADQFLAHAGSGVATHGVPMAAGVPEASVAGTLILPFNDTGALAALRDVRGDEIAAFFVEPVPANMGVVLPDAGFLLALADAARETGALLVFDEVVTGFRLGAAGAQGLFGITPDLTMLGKVIGGGLPVGAVGGRAGIMDLLSPVGPVYQAGTYAAHPHAMAAGATVLEALTQDVYGALEQTARVLAEGLAGAAEREGAKAHVVRAGTILSVFFGAAPPRTFDDVRAGDREAFARFHRALRQDGVLVPPSMFEAWFPSVAHTRDDVRRTVESARAAFAAAAGEGT